jgi:hypothetical protein
MWVRALVGGWSGSEAWRSDLPVLLESLTECLSNKSVIKRQPKQNETPTTHFGEANAFQLYRTHSLCASRPKCLGHHGFIHALNPPCQEGRININACPKSNEKEPTIKPKICRLKCDLDKRIWAEPITHTERPPIPIKRQRLALVLAYQCAELGLGV